MPTSETTPLPPLTAWQALALRLSAFRRPQPKIEQTTWWTDLVGHPPDKVTSQPKLGLHQEEGLFASTKLSLQLQLDRVDWTLAPDTDAPSENFELPTLGPFPDALATFTKLTGQWLTVAPPITRLAFGAFLSQPVDDHQAGYRLIDRYLPKVTLDPEGISDFLYQINRPRTSRSGVPSLKINRLMKWSVMLFSGLSVTITVGPGSAPATTSNPVVRYAGRLELDINTVPDPTGTELPREVMPSLLQELVELGRQIAAEGDVP